jgi:hypothetical protein
LFARRLNDATWVSINIAETVTPSIPHTASMAALVDCLSLPTRKATRSGLTPLFYTAGHAADKETTNPLFGGIAPRSEIAGKTNLPTESVIAMSLAPLRSAVTVAPGTGAPLYLTQPLYSATTRGHQKKTIESRTVRAAERVKLNAQRRSPPPAEVCAFFEVGMLGNAITCATARARPDIT